MVLVAGEGRTLTPQRQCHINCCIDLDRCIDFVRVRAAQIARHYPWCNASIGSSAAARRAGTKPNTTPMAAENRNNNRLMPASN